jgi:hypothetical protein
MVKPMIALETEKRHTDPGIHQYVAKAGEHAVAVGVLKP